jgi:hypothetical protein
VYSGVLSRLGQGRGSTHHLEDLYYLGDGVRRGELGAADVDPQRLREEVGGELGGVVGVAPMMARTSFSNPMSSMRSASSNTMYFTWGYTPSRDW